MHFIYFYLLHIHMSIYSNFNIRGHLIWQNEKSEIHQKPCPLTHQENRSPRCVVAEKEPRNWAPKAPSPQIDTFLQNSQRQTYP